MHIENAVVLVTGSNRGIGLEFAKEALARGARKVYASARDPAGIGLVGAEPIGLDVASAEQVLDLAVRLGDVQVLINNAGFAETGGFLAAGGEASFRRQLEVNFFGVLRMTRAFASILAANGGGAIVNMLSAASWRNQPGLSTYGATKTAAWALTNGIRNDLRSQGTQVLAVHVGPVDTDATRLFNVPKTAPRFVAQRSLDALEAGDEEVLVDEIAQRVKRGLTSTPPYYLNPWPASVHRRAGRLIRRTSACRRR